MAPDTAARVSPVVRFGILLASRVSRDTPPRARFASFRADHFTARGKTNVPRVAISPHVDFAVPRPVAGRFADLLISSAKPPLILHCLDQQASAAPNSPQVLRIQGPDRDEQEPCPAPLERHRLGMDGSCTQDDVRQLVEPLPLWQARTACYALMGRDTHRTQDRYAR